MKRRMTKEELKAKVKKNRKKIIIGGLLISGTIIGVKAYSNKQYIKGAAAMKELMAAENYEKIKKDVLEAHLTKLFDDAYGRNLKNWVEDVKGHRVLDYVGWNQRKDYLEHLLKDPNMRAHAMLLINAKAGDVVKSF